MSKPLRILVIGGMHGNEPLGVNLVKLLTNTPLNGVETLIANPSAVKANKRFIESDLNRSFGAQYKGTSETRRARQVMQYAKQYDIVLDFHNTMTPGNNCTFVGADCDTQLYTVSKRLGLKNCIEATYDCVNKYCPNTISIEISLGDSLDNARYWYRQIETLMSNGLNGPKAKLSIYRFQRRVTWEEAKDNDIKGWEPFTELNVADKKALDIKIPMVPIFIGSTLTEYYATLLSKERIV